MEYIDNNSLIIEIQNNSEYIRKLRRLQTVIRVLKCLTWIPYDKDIKIFRRNVREYLKDIEDVIPKYCATVNIVSREVRERIFKIMCREVERVFKCRLTRSKADYEFCIRFYNRGILFCLNISSFQPLYRRWYTKCKSRASLNPIIAAAMCIIAGKWQQIVDPFSGSYTIPIEYIRMWGRSHVLCVDIAFNVLEKSISNIVTADVYQYVDVICSDYFKVKLENVECIITDPPRGIRLRSSITLYRRFLEKARHEIYEDGCIVFITFSKVFKKIKNMVESLGLRVENKIETVQGGYRVNIVKLVKQ